MRYLRTGELVLLCVSAMQLGAAVCEPEPGPADAVPTVVHVVYGPFPEDGNPALVHHLEHLLVRQERAVLPRWSSLDGWTGPETLHLVWQGMATEAHAACVAERLGAVPLDAESVRAAWPSLDAEVAFERGTTDPSASDRLRMATAPIHSRYRLPLRGAVGFDPAVVDLLTDVPRTTVVAAGDQPVRWTQTGMPPRVAGSLSPLERPPEATLAWTVKGATSCEQQRALWAALAGVADATGGTPVGWLGLHGGVLGVVDGDTTGWSKRKALRAAMLRDAEAVRTTARQSGEVTARAWMAVGALGLGVCPAQQPVEGARLKQALGWLSAGTVLSPEAAPAATGQLEVPPREWAAIWQAGAPPPGWLDHPDVYGTRTPGGYTLDGPPTALQTWAAQHPPAAPLGGLDAVGEQALVLTGAAAVEVPCRTLGIDASVCGAPGQLRVPTGASVVVVDSPQRAAVQVTLVRAVDPSEPDVRAALSARLGPESDLARALEASAGVRDLRLDVEPVRARVSFRVGLSFLPTALQLLQPHLGAPGPAGHAALPAPGAVASATTRLTGRPWEAVHQPGPSPTDPHASLGLSGGALLVLEGPADPVEAVLSAQGVGVTRSLSAAQLVAESGSIR